MVEEEEPTTPPEPTDELFEKRRLRTKIKILRRERSPSEYKAIKVTVDGRQRAVSQSSKFFLDQLTADDDVTEG